MFFTHFYKKAPDPPNCILYLPHAPFPERYFTTVENRTPRVRHSGPEGYGMADPRGPPKKHTISATKNEGQKVDLLSALHFCFSFFLDERHARFSTFLAHLIWPDGGLYLAYMGLVEEHHAETALTYSSTYRERHFIAH